MRLMAVRHCGGGLSFRVKCDKFDEEFHIGMQGDFNAENAVAADCRAGYIYGVPAEIMKKSARKRQSQRQNGRIQKQ